MANLSTWGPRRVMPQFSNLLDEDWGWLDYPSNEIDMYEQDDDLIIKLKAPGFKRDDINITITAGVVTITGSVKEEEKQEDRKKNYFRREMKSNSFTRKIDLPFAVKSDQSRANFENGILQLTLPKAEEAKPKTVQIS